MPPPAQRRFQARRWRAHVTYERKEAIKIAIGRSIHWEPRAGLAAEPDCSHAKILCLVLNALAFLDDKLLHGLRPETIL